MGVLNFQTGRKTYTVNDGCEITFDPTDAQFAGKVVKAFRNCIDIQKNGAPKQLVDIDELVSVTEKMTADIRAEIDEVFSEGVCDKVFGGSSPIAIADDLPVWANFLMAVIDEIDQNTPEGQTRARERVQHYMSKYEAKYGKYMRK